MGQRRPLIDLVKAIRTLAAESTGVAGLHNNGEVATWEELLPGGRFESWIGEALAAVEKILSRPKESRPCQEFPLAHAPGLTLYRQPNEVGGHTYLSDEIGGGVWVWDTSLVDDRTLRAALEIEERYGLPKPPLQGIPYEKLKMCPYLCWDRRVPGWVVAVWTDRWMVVRGHMLLEPKAQQAAHDSLIPCMELNEEPEE